MDDIQPHMEVQVYEIVPVVSYHVAHISLIIFIISKRRNCHQESTDGSTVDQ